MAGLFPDPYVHIGGDEVTGKHWDENPAIQQFMEEHGLPDNHALQAYFNERVSRILAKYDKRMIGWDEILHPDLPAGTLVQSWRGQASLAEAARSGFDGILSFGYYLDHMFPASFHAGVDPLADADLTERQRARTARTDSKRKTRLCIIAPRARNPKSVIIAQTHRAHASSVRRTTALVPDPAEVPNPSSRSRELKAKTKTKISSFSNFFKTIKQ